MSKSREDLRMYIETSAADITAIMDEVFGSDPKQHTEAKSQSQATQVISLEELEQPTRIEVLLRKHGPGYLWKKFKHQELLPLAVELIDKIALQREHAGGLTKAGESYSPAELNLLSIVFRSTVDSFKPKLDRKSALSLDEVQALLDQLNFGNLRNFNSEQAWQYLQGKQFSLAGLAALSDNQSYFFYDVKNHALGCYIAPAAQIIRLKPNSNRFESVMKSGDKRNYPERSHVTHCYLLYLAMQGQLKIDDAVSNLFGKKDEYWGFFDRVLNTINQIFALGLNNLTKDLYEKVKALLVQASSYRIVFLAKDLDELQAKLSNALAWRSQTDLPAIFDLLCRIINTVEALRHTQERNQLITLLGLNQGHTYIVNNMAVIGCGAAFFDTATADGNVQTRRYYFFDFQGKRFVVIKTLVTDYFWSNNYLFDTGNPLFREKYSCLNLSNLFVTNNKVKNSQYSSASWSPLGGETNNPLIKRCRHGLYDLFAFDNFEHLKQVVYEQEGDYFGTVTQTSGIHLVKVNSVLGIDKSNPFSPVVHVQDKHHHSLDVNLLINNNNSQELQNQFEQCPQRFSNCYFLLQCPIVYGLMRPTLLTFFGLAPQPQNNNNKKKNKNHHP